MFNTVIKNESYLYPNDINNEWGFFVDLDVQHNHRLKFACNKYKYQKITQSMITIHETTYDHDYEDECDDEYDKYYKNYEDKFYEREYYDCQEKENDKYEDEYKYKKYSMTTTKTPFCSRITNCIKLFYFYVFII